MTNRKLLVTIFILLVVMLWAGYSSRKTAKAVRKFEPTAARLERGRYIIEGPAPFFECHSEVDWETPGAQPKAGKKGAGTPPVRTIRAARLTGGISGRGPHGKKL